MVSRLDKKYKLRDALIFVIFMVNPQILYTVAIPAALAVV